jgi:hypothetical protein
MYVCNVMQAGLFMHMGWAGSVSAGASSRLGGDELTTLPETKLLNSDV